MKLYDTKMAVREKLKRDMVERLEKSFELLNTLIELKLSYLKKCHPNKTEAQLSREIYQNIVEVKERQWNLHKI